VPQSGFLSLMMTGDGSSIGSKFGIAFVGKWVWELKDMIDMSFMDLFNPNYLFENYKENGTKTPIENGHINADRLRRGSMAKDKCSGLDPAEAAEILGCSTDETNYDDRWAILTRMHFEEDFRA
jgi:hypothetical protein